jgi:hypothetical protein
MGFTGLDAAKLATALGANEVINVVPESVRERLLELTGASGRRRALRFVGGHCPMIAARDHAAWPNATNMGLDYERFGHTALIALAVPVASTAPAALTCRWARVRARTSLIASPDRLAMCSPRLPTIRPARQ